MTPEQKAKAKRREYYRKRRAMMSWRKQRATRTAEQLEAYRAYQREYHRKRRSK